MDSINLCNIKKALLAFFVRQKETKMEESVFYDNWYGGNWVFPNGSTEDWTATENKPRDKLIYATSRQ